MMKQDLVARFQRWVIVAIVLCCLLYLAGSVWSGFTDIQTELVSFNGACLVRRSGYISELHLRL